MRQANASPHILSFLFVPSEVKQSLGPCGCSLCSQTVVHHTQSAYTKATSPVLTWAISASAAERETTHERVEITSSWLSRVTTSTSQ